MAKKAAGMKGPPTKTTASTSSVKGPSPSVEPTDVPVRPPRERTTERGLSLPLILIFLLVPLISLVWTPEAPNRPFALVRPVGTASSLSLIQPRVLLVTAHPDDELLFAPTILSLLSEEKKRDVSLWTLCLSTGDAGGDALAGGTLGEVRQEEWAKSWEVLGLGEGSRVILDVPTLRDNASAEWDASAIAAQVEPFVLKHDINAILTFDAGGITQHPNHKSLPAGISNLLASKTLKKKLKGKTVPRFFTLATVSWRSQHGPLAPLIEHLSLSVRTVLRLIRAERAGTADAPGAITAVPNTVFISDVRRYVQAWRALLQHRTQMSPQLVALGVLGKYLWVNEWVEIVGDVVL